MCLGRLKRKLRKLRRIPAHHGSDIGVIPPFLDWSLKYLDPYFPDRPFSEFHHWLIDELSKLQDNRNTRLNVVAPRGNAKSTWSTFAYPLYCAVHGLEPYIILTADTG